MSIAGSCHCGEVRVDVPFAPEWIGSCNCSICRKLGTLMAYYPDDGSVKIHGHTISYIWGDRMIATRHCPVCACVTHWESTGESYGRIGVNVRLLDGFELAQGRFLLDGQPLEVRYLENATT